MPADLPVHVNRETLHSLDVQPSFEAHGPFDVRLVNHGESVHVHVHLGDGLSRIASIDAANHFVEGESTRVVRVDVEDEALGSEPIRGKLKVASAYGAQTRWIDVELSEPTPDETPVEVDESLAKPSPVEDASGSSPLRRPEVAVLALGFVALVVAIAAALVADDTFLQVGSLVVLGGVLVAMFFLSRGQLTR